MAHVLLRWVLAGLAPSGPLLAQTAPGVTAPVTGSATHFSATLATTAPPAAVWAVWTDVANWPSWDTGLRAAALAGPWGPQAQGQLTPDRGPVARFTVVEYVQGQAYTLRTKLPLGALLVRRSWRQQDGRTWFTHEVTFTGFSKPLFGLLLGRRYRGLLPQVLTGVRAQAEARATAGQ
jgi:hypothetical protein